MSSYSAVVMSWQLAREFAVPIRRTVFIDEQNVPEELEWDAFDEPGFHVLVFDDASRKVVATARLSPRGNGLCFFNRLAVLAPWRGSGAGRLLMETLLDEARRRSQRNLELHAQTRARGFYERFGFAAEGEPYLEAGIEHITMRRTLAPPA
ncbi:MAG TPA: GNAT family N-acetyltransferase [Rhodocyclaceae bacterium]|nr:GNAT family N-acetyltransferase [Rhodocyclaceae bacterium]HMV54487.1 GNAT family N-acetyltransferase [Rhodocyclaceae bacterium]HNA03955.1 GNAT family N-acetyltransferase [Rhodocyclaceae bacterium]HNB78156.1 GNAT family N-acetyltransferase [Rhodocyclaceae bacterium]HNC60251.1 GNAT family N-acetyltransferase [Rhodocyclaceae bacterium]